MLPGFLRPVSRPGTTLPLMIIRKLCIPFMIMLLAAACGACAPARGGEITVQEAAAPVSPGRPVTSGTQQAYDSAAETAEVQTTGVTGSTDGFPFHYYVTPDDEAITALAAGINGAADAYRLAVAWTYVSETTLNNAADKWLSPHEFLTGTMHYPGNPLPGQVVSDCEEQSHALVSLIRAEDVPPEAVRIVIGKVTFNNTDKGHAWVELFVDGGWLPLDPMWGPYWDDADGELVERDGMPFDYYADHDYPVLEVWAYYNDIYYLDPESGAGNAPDSWRA